MFILCTPCLPYTFKSRIDFNVIHSKCSNTTGLVDWVVNIVIYYDTIIGVEPKRRALANATERLDAANATLSQMKEKVNNLEARLKKLTDAYNAANAGKNKIKKMK